MRHHLHVSLVVCGNNSSVYIPHTLRCNSYRNVVLVIQEIAKNKKEIIDEIVFVINESVSLNNNILELYISQSLF